MSDPRGGLAGLIHDEHEDELLSGFMAEEAERGARFLRKLVPHLTQDEFCVVGGVAIRYHTIAGGLDYPARPFNDIDLIAKRLDSIRPTITNDFMIGHVHGGKTPDDFYLVVVDPDTKMKADIFNWQSTNEKIRLISLGNVDIPLVDTAHQLATTVRDLQKVTRGEVVDPKQFEDARRLQLLADPDQIEPAWADTWPGSDLSLAEAALLAEESAAQHPELLREKPYRKPRPYACTECVVIPGYPITPMGKVYQALGYIE